MSGLLEDSLSLPLRLVGDSLRHPFATRRGDENARPRSRERRIATPNALGQDLFRGVLSRERKRADRFDQPFVLVLLRHKDRQRPESSSVWPAAIEALAAAKRDTDVLGWFKQGSALGMVLPEMGGCNPAATREVKDRVRRALAARLDAETVTRYSIRLHLYSGATAPATAHPAPKDPLLLRLRHRADQRGVRDFVKRGLDILGSMALLSILFPLFSLVAVLVKLTSAGPVFFRQARVGQMGQTFLMLKFRTMYVNADESVHQKYVSEYIKSSAPAAGAESETPFKLVNDTRVTRIGNFLRRTSLDELPQFWNVLRGDMSLVGPRPPLPYEVKEYKPWHYRRVLEAKPGVTGLWQVTGRSRTTFEDMVRLDLRYARTRSFWTDIEILLATPRAVISGKGAC